MSILSLDIETFTAAEVAADGTPLPSEGWHHPVRSMRQGSVRRDHLVLTAAVTVAKRNNDHFDFDGGGHGYPLPRGAYSYKYADWIKSQSWLDHISGSELARLEPGPTLLTDYARDDDRRALLKVLSGAQVIIGHNIVYDLLFLRASHPSFWELLGDDILLVDTGVLNFLDNESAPERSLKDLCLVHGIHRYTRTLKTGRFAHPTLPDADGWTLGRYNAQDSHCTLLLCAHLARRILAHHGLHPKLSPYSLRFFSDCLWSCVRTSEAGIPFDVAALQSVGAITAARVRYAASAMAHAGIIERGKGSNKSRDRFLAECIAAAPPCRLEVTKTKRKPRWSPTNRIRLRLALPAGHPLRRAMMAADDHAHMEGILKNFIRPLLGTGDSCLLSADNEKEGRQVQTVGVGYPFWRCIPSPTKDDSGDSGGQRQARASCSKPPGTTFPDSIKKCYRSRFPGGVILWADASQHELRAAGMLSGEPSLIAAYKEGRDLHTDRAVAVFGASVLTHPQFHSLHRQAGKHGNFADLNLASPETLWNTILKKSGIDVGLDICRRIVDSRERTRPVLTAWQRSLVEYARRRHRLVLPFTGHSCEFPPSLDWDESKIVNLPIQGVAAATVWAIQHHFQSHHLPPLSSPSPSRLLFLNIYDALAIDCASEELALQTQADLQLSMRYVQDHGYWAWWQELTKNEVPLALDFKLIKGPQ